MFFRMPAAVASPNYRLKYSVKYVGRGFRRVLVFAVHERSTVGVGAKSAKAFGAH